jgi:uncharacterized protein
MEAKYLMNAESPSGGKRACGLLSGASQPKPHSPGLFSPLTAILKPKVVFALILTCALLGRESLFAIDVPRLSGPVVDAAGTLSGGEKERIGAFLRDFDAGTKAQIAVCIVPELGGEDVDDFAMRVFDEWKIGEAALDSGALLLVAMAEREVAIKVGYGVEGTLTDAQCGLIIRRVIVPAFQKGDYGDGILSGVRAMSQVISGDATFTNDADDNESAKEPRFDWGGALFGLLVFIIVIIVLSNQRRRLRRRGLGGVFIPPIIYGGGLGGRGTHGPFTGGGSSGFGGGGFRGGGGRSGGGGASGKW